MTTINHMLIASTNSSYMCPYIPEDHNFKASPTTDLETMAFEREIPMI